MASQKRALSPPTPPTPLRARTRTRPLLSVQSSPLSSGSLISYPVTTASFESSPDLSQSDDSLGSPEYLEPFEYTPEMEVDLQRIDAEAAGSQLEHNNPPSSAESRVNSPPQTRADSPPSPTHAESPPSTPHRKQKTWVVFQGREPGVYDCVYIFLLEIKQTRALTLVFLGCLRHSRPKGSVIIFNEPTLTAKPLMPHGARICVMERSLIMAGPLGSFMSVDGSALWKGCKYLMPDSQFLLLT